MSAPVSRGLTAAEHVLIRGKVFLYKQKAPFVPSGKSVLGALEYKKISDRVKCHECGEWFKMLGSHVVQVHGLTPKEYRVAHGLRMKTPLCGPKYSAYRASVAGTAPQLVRHQHQFPDIAKKALSSAHQSRRRSLAASSQPFMAERPLFELRNENGSCQAQLMARLKALATRLGKTPTNREILADGMSPQSICVALNVTDLNQAFSLIGLVRITPGQTGTPGGWNKLYNRQILIEMLRDFHAKYGRLPTNSDRRAGLIPGHTIFGKIFGSMANAYEAAGLARVAAEQWPTRRSHTRDSLVRKLLEYVAEHETLPPSKHFNNQILPGVCIFVHHFGSMGKAYEEAGLSDMARQRSEARKQSSREHSVSILPPDGGVA